jgi:predicted cobalt transporter CbtA
MTIFGLILIFAGVILTGFSAAYAAAPPSPLGKSVYDLTDKELFWVATLGFIAMGAGVFLILLKAYR